MERAVAVDVADDQLASLAHQACQLGEDGIRVGEVLEDELAPDEIEGLRSERKTVEIIDDESQVFHARLSRDPRASAGPVQRKIQRDYLAGGADHLRHHPRHCAGARPRVERTHTRA